MDEDTWHRRTEWPLSIAALLFLGAYAWPILQTDLDAHVRRACRLTEYLASGAFAVDYAARLILTTQRSRFVRTHLFDLATLVLPLLRPLRLLRLVVLMRVLNRRATAAFRGRVVLYVVSSAAVVILVAALAALNAERGRRGASIETFGDALWWATTTVTTVGYGDRYPVTTEGRWIAVGLMLCGIALIGSVTATIASWLIEHVRAVEEDADESLRLEIVGLRTDVAELRALLRATTSTSGPQDARSAPLPAG